MAISSFTWPTSGIMISGRGSLPARFTATAALRIARVWIFTKSGIISPRRQPRRPSIGFCSCIDLMVARSSLSSSLAASPAFVTLTSCSSRFGRNSWSGGSIRRMTTGRPLIAARMPSKSPCWSTSSLAIAASNVATALGLVGRRAPRRRRPWPWRGSPRWRRGSRRGRSPGARPRGTCARCGRGRCPGRRSRGPGRPPRACRRWSRSAAGGSRRPSPGSAGARAGPRSGPRRSAARRRRPRRSSRRR